jgi:DNA-binding protein HU-beta
MKKNEFVSLVSEKVGDKVSKKTIEETISAVWESIKEVLKSGDSISFVEFGTFSVVQKEAKKGRNPRTGEEITIPARKVVKFKGGKRLKEEF